MRVEEDLFCKEVGEGLSKRVRFDQRHELGKSRPGRYKGPKARAFLACLRTRVSSISAGSLVKG